MKRSKGAPVAEIQYSIMSVERIFSQQVISKFHFPPSFTAITHLWKRCIPPKWYLCWSSNASNPHNWSFRLGFGLAVSFLVCELCSLFKGTFNFLWVQFYSRHEHYIEVVNSCVLEFRAVYWAESQRKAQNWVRTYNPFEHQKGNQVAWNVRWAKPVPVQHPWDAQVPSLATASMWFRIQLLTTWEAFWNKLVLHLIWNFLHLEVLL